MEYYEYFRLKGPPFQPATPNGVVYFSPTHLEGLTTLESGLLKDLSGLTMLTGEAGTGKTTLIYSLLQRDHKRVRIAHIDDPKLSFLEIMRVVLTQMNLYSPGQTKLDYISVLEHLLDLHGKEERIAIVVDEAQVLSFDVLEELRLLSNRGQRNDRCLQLVLVGQPELAERLKKPELRQLNQRISSRGVLRPLNTTEAVMYVECKLVAQGGKCAGIFEPRALPILLKRSDGIPRKINMLCHNAMTAAFYAGERKVSVRVAKKVAAEYHDSVSITQQRRRRRLGMPGLIGATAVASALLVLGFAYPDVWSGWIHRQPASAAGVNEHPARTETRAERRKAAELRREAKAITPVAVHPAVAPASSAPDAASRVVPKTEAPGSAAAAEIPAVPPTPAVSVSAATPKAEVVSASAPRRSQVIVKYGDTLEKIAVRYLGSEIAVNQLIKANPQLTSIDQLSVGQIIYLPTGYTPKTSQDEDATERTLTNADR